MPSPSPLVLSLDLAPRFLLRGEGPGARHSVQLGPDDQGFVLPTSEGGLSQLPPKDGQESACRDGEAKVKADEWNPAHRWPLAANFNNLAVLQILDSEWMEANRAINWAVEHLEEISMSFSKPVPAAIRGIAVARYNLSVVCFLIENYEGGREEVASARQGLAAIPAEKRDSDFDLVESALLDLGNRFA